MLLPVAICPVAIFVSNELYIFVPFPLLMLTLLLEWQEQYTAGKNQIHEP